MNQKQIWWQETQRHARVSYFLQIFVKNEHDVGIVLVWVPFFNVLQITFIFFCKKVMLSWTTIWRLKFGWWKKSNSSGEASVKLNIFQINTSFGKLLHSYPIKRNRKTRFHSLEKHPSSNLVSTQERASRGNTKKLVDPSDSSWCTKPSKIILTYDCSI